MPSLKVTTDLLKERVRRRIAGLDLTFLRLLGRVRPIPLEYWRRRRELLAMTLHGPNPGLPAHGRSHRALRAAPELEALLRGRDLGGFAMEADALAYVWSDLLARRPVSLVEVGSGTSTLVLGHFCARHGRPGARVLSIDQNDAVARSSMARCADAGLASIVRVVHVPMEPDGQFDERSLLDALANLDQPFDWLLIDGPFGPPGCRGHLGRALLERGSAEARWFLDDALRTAELQVLSEWKRHARIVVEGIVPVGQGLAQGRLRPPSPGPADGS